MISSSSEVANVQTSLNRSPLKKLHGSNSQQEVGITCKMNKATSKILKITKVPNIYKLKGVLN
jgi:hypothetical protein